MNIFLFGRSNARLKKPMFVVLLLSTAGMYFGCSHEFAGDLGYDADRGRWMPTAKQDLTPGIYLPSSTDFTSIPNQDPKNPITTEKVDLGKMLFFETGLGLEPTYPVSKETYSCSSCHIPERSFTAGRFQGIADGAVGYGQSGEKRKKNPYYEGDEVDAQGARPLPMLNLAYVTNALWAGSFGSYNVNTGTESAWDNDTLFRHQPQRTDGA